MNHFLTIALAAAVTACVFEEVRYEDLWHETKIMVRDLDECRGELQNEPVRREPPPPSPPLETIPVRYSR